MANRFLHSKAYKVYYLALALTSLLCLVMVGDNERAGLHLLGWKYLILIRNRAV